MKIAYLFPGQGSQKPWMLHTLPKHPAVQQVLNEAREILDGEIDCLDSKESLESTVAVQLSLLIASVAVARAFESEGVRPDIVAGHSVGAFSAAVTSKTIEFADALKLVRLRGRLMEQAFPSGYGMGVVTGTDARTVKEITASCFTEKDPVYAANINASDQITVSGSLEGINRVIDQARKKGARTAELLNVSIPSHCPILETVSHALEEELSGIHMHSPEVPYACNRTARLLRSAEQIRDDLAFNVSHPVKWHDISTILCEFGTRLFIEMPPGNVLTTLAKRALPGARSVSVEENGFKNCLFLGKRYTSIQS
ncbi:malonate decarboxylase subunit epsilon [Mesobacillus boroniphilus]|uniref:Malonyl CoA-acyl carrier protein transacylase n=1 Tax=Mesobacillus boroniphilus TaxID=308892 RepID=A0A944CJE3_9BACI|nr:malonate decarboxylase subunit epsilon [Mesobacillus boroniphilus]MBS8263869.1 malonate decarboxylase subunit epsilon [Mesobacillus boroniphilus]